MNVVIRGEEERWGKGKKELFLTLIMDQLEEIILCFKYSEEFFIKNTKTIEFFLEINIIKKEINCVRCDNRMCIMVAATYIDGHEDQSQAQRRDVKWSPLI